MIEKTGTTAGLDLPDQAEHSRQIITKTMEITKKHHRTYTSQLHIIMPNADDSNQHDVIGDSLSQSTPTERLL